MVAAGVAIGFMLLSRTMAVAFLPGIAVGFAVLLRRERGVLTNLGISVGTAALIAGPWWIAEWGSTSTYLLGYGFGHESTDYGASGVLERVGVRVGHLAQGLRPFAGLTVLVVLASVVTLVTVGFGTGRLRPSRWSDPTRGLVAVALTTGLSFATLCLSRNGGWLFEPPVLVLGVVVIASLASRLPRPLPRIAGVVAVAMSALVIIASATDPAGGGRGHDALAAPRMILYGGVAEYLGMEGSDHRLDTGDATEVATAAREWWQVNRTVLARLDTTDRGPEPIRTVLGSCRVFNSATLELVSRLDSWREPAPITGARERDGRATIERELAPRSGGRRRVLVVVDSACVPYPGDETDDVLDIARSLGWRPTERVPLPDGGAAVVWRHRSS
jgi:hypothetical protein